MQILGVVIPKLQEWQDQGAVGQRKITQWTRYLAIAIASLQATGLTFLFGRGGGGALLCGQGRHPTWCCCPASRCTGCCSCIMTLTAGTVPAHVDGRAHHPAGHRQRHVDPDLRVGGQPAAVPVLRRPARRRSSSSSPSWWLISHRHPGGHRVHRAGPAPHTRAVRQAGGGPAHVRRPEHLHPAEGQPVRRHPDHLRQLGAAAAGACSPTSSTGSGSRTSSTTTSSTRRTGCTCSSTAC